MGEALGVDPVSDFGIEGYTRNMEEAAKNMASIQDPFEEIGGVGDAATYAAGILGEQLPQLLLSIGGAGIGGYAAKTVAKKVVANEIVKRLTAGMAKEEAEREVAKLVAQKALQGFATKAQTQAIEKAAEVGALGGAYAANVGQIAGGSFGQIEQETGQRDPVNALGFALLGGALETAGEAVLAAPIAKKLLGTAAADAIQAGTQGVESKALGFNLGPKARVAGQLIAAPATEGGTEYAQTYLEQAAVAAADPNRTLEEVTGTPQAERERLLAATAGAVAGGGFGGISQAASYLIPETARAVQSKLAQRQVEQEQGQTEQAQEEQPQQSLADSGWSEAITIPSNDEKFNGIQYRQNKAGQVVAFNVPENSPLAQLAVPTQFGPGVLISRGLDGAAEIRSEVKAQLAEKADPSKFTVPAASKPTQENLEDADLPDGPASISEEDPIAAAVERRRQRDEEVMSRDREFATTTLNRPVEDAQGFVDGLQEGDQVSVLTEDGEDNTYAIPMTFVRRNQQGQAILRSEADENNNVKLRAYDPDEFNRITTRVVRQEESDPAGADLMEALGPNPTKEQWQAVTGTPWTGPGSKHTALVKDGLGGDGIPVTYQLFNRKNPVEPVATPQRQVNKGFKPEDQTTAPAAPEIASGKTNLVAKSSAQFVGITDAKNNPVNQRPTRGEENATYLERIDSAADTTIRQMNYLGQPVLVTPETAQSLSEANAFWEEHADRQRAGQAKADRQPVKFFTQERSDKDGNRNTYITGVTYEGRTYRVGKTPDDFSVDRPLTMRGGNSRRRGRGIYDPIRRASLTRQLKSEAGMQASKTEGGPLAAALTGVRGRPAMPELNEAENAVFAFFDNQITKPILEAQGDDINDGIRDSALERARATLAKAFVKARENKRPAPTQVLPARQRLIGQKVTEKLEQYRDAKVALAASKLREKFQALSNKAKTAKAGVRGTGAGKALKLSPESANKIIAEARRGQKTGISEAKRISRDEALQLLQEVVDFGALDQTKKDDMVRRIFGEGEKFTELDREFMSDQIISDLRDADRALATRQGREYTKTPAEEAQDRKLVKATFDLLADPSIRNIKPFSIGQSALNNAKRTFVREEINRPTESLDDETSRAAQEAALTDTGAVTQASLAEKGKPVGIEGAEGGDIAPFTNNFEEAMNLLDGLPTEDQDLFLRYAEKEFERQGGGRSQNKQPLSEVDRLWVRRIKSYLDGNITQSQLEAFRNEERRLVERTPPRATPAELANLRRGVSTEAALSGVAESRARRSPNQATEGRSDGAAGSATDTAGSVQERNAGTTGGRGVQPTPQRTRAVAAAAQRDFSGALLGLNEAETAALPQTVVDRIYEAYLATFDAKRAEETGNPLTASAAPMADTVTADGKRLIERYAKSLTAPPNIRAAEIRQNMAQAYRAGLFDDDPVVSAINKLSKDKTQPRQVQLIAKELAKNEKRGVRFDRVALDIGRFTNKGERTSWAGLFNRTPDGGSVVSINLDNLHDQDSLPLTFLHEIQHVVIRDKVNRNIPLTRTEEAALKRIEDFRREAVIAAAKDKGLNVGQNPDVDALAKQLYAMTDQTQSGADAADRRLAGLVNTEEFVIEMIGNPDMVGLLSELGFGEARKDGKKFTLSGAIKRAWDAVVELVTGTKVDPNSPLAMAFKDSWTMNFGTSRNPNITEIKTGRRNTEQQRAQVERNYVEQEVEARNLAGTGQERRAIMREVTGPAEPTAREAAQRVREAALSMGQGEFAQWATDNGFAFENPYRVWADYRVEEQQSARDMGQGAESRAVGSQVAVVPDGGVEKEFHTLNTVEDTNGDVGLDLSKLIVSLRDKSSQVGGEVSGKKFLVIVDDERREFTTLPALQRFLANAGIPGGTIARVFRNANNQIAVNFDENINQATERAIREQTRNVAESRAVQRVSPADAGRALVELARQSGDNFFSFPAQLSTSKNLQEVADSTGRKLRVFGNNDALVVAADIAPKVGSEVTFLDKDGIISEGTLTSIDGRTATILHKQRKVYEKAPLKNTVSGLNIRAVGNAQSRQFYIDSGAGFEANIPESSAIYQSIYQWAFNNGYTIIEDPRGTSYEGNFRRNAHQLSSAIRVGSADHFLPNSKGPDSQLEKMFPGAPRDRRLSLWNGLNFEEKIATLARAETAYIEQAVPDLVSIVYDAERDIFTDERTGESLGRDEARKRIDSIIEEEKKRRTPDTDRIRIRTMSRYGATKSALEGSLGPVVGRSDNRRPNLEPALYSRARGRVWRKITKTTPTGGKISQGGMFSVDELLDKQAGDAYRTSRASIKADVSQIQELNRRFERQMKSLYKGQTAPLDTINTALGNLENPLNAQQIGEIERLRGDNKPKQADKLRDRYLRENRKKFKEVTQPEALAQLPEDLAETIREMSSHIESLSSRLKESDGLVSGDLAATIDQTLGTYLNRSYAIFDDPTWSDRIRKNAKVVDAARKFIRNSLVETKTADLIDGAKSEGRTLSKAQAQAMANKSVTDDEIERMLEGYLAIGDEAPTVEILSGRIPGQKNLSMFNRRGNIAPEIQALWGRYEDPKVNYAKTVMKLSSAIANNDFLTELRDIGVEEGWLWSRKDNPDDLRHPPGYVRISSDNNPTLTPIAGMYAHPMLAEGLFKMFPVGSTEEHYWWLRSAMKLTGISMAMKTVGSVASQIRNYLGNYLNLIAGGNLGLGDIASGDFARRFKNSTDLVLANTFDKYRNATRAEWRAKIDDYIRRGIVGESITTGLLEDLLTTSRRAGSPDWGDYVWDKVSTPFKNVADFATRTYSAGDDWFKVMIYEAEQDKYRKAYPEWDDEKIKQKAAENARDIHWTYSLAPAVVQDLKKFPFVAPFVTFTTEVIRTTYNTMKLARKEIMEGRETGNKELENIGWKRVRGMATAAFLPAAVGSASMALAGISGDDEEDLRRFLPDWQKNSQLLLFRKENGEVSFVDISFLDPYEYFKKPLVAFTRSLRNADSADEILLDGTMSMVRQALDPFTSEQIFAGAIMDVMRNTDAAGRQVFNPQDTGANIGTAVARKIFIEPFTPGTFSSLDRIGKAAFGIQSESGRAYDLFNEISSVMLGQRVSQMDAQQALQFKGSRFMREIRDASALFNREFVAQGTRSAGDVVSGYERSNAARRALIENIRNDYNAAIRLGVPVQRAKAILRDAGLGKDTLKMVTTGIYKPFDASQQSLDLVRSRGNTDRIAAYNQAKRNAPTREVLP